VHVFHESITRSLDPAATVQGDPDIDRSIIIPGACYPRPLSCFSPIRAADGRSTVLMAASVRMGATKALEDDRRAEIKENSPG
jgi:hypothetical protein